MCLNLTKRLTFSPEALVWVVPTLLLLRKQQNTRGFTFFRFFRDLTWLSLLVLNSIVNKRTILTYGFYVQKLNCLTVFSEQPLIQDIKEHISIRDNLLYNNCVGMPLFLKKDVNSSN